MLPIPEKFMQVRYNANCYPGNCSGLVNGANCQHFVYEFIRELGPTMIEEFPNLRSKELYEDTKHTYLVSADNLLPFDIVLFNKEPSAYGAHVGICVDDEKKLILHLCKKIGKPEIVLQETLLEDPDYKYLIGVKRCLSS